jgi:hypothetical protein
VAESSQQGADPSADGVKMTKCGLCDRQFTSIKALQRHERYSPAHVTKASRKGTVEATLNTVNAVGLLVDHPHGSTTILTQSTQRLQAPHTKAIIFHCSQCDRSFRSMNALQAHKDNSLAHTDDSSWSMHPDLHHEVSQRLEADGLSVDFYEEGEFEDSVREYDTTIMGAFICPKQSCPMKKWTSMKIAISIHLYDKQLYNALVWHQRCQKCKNIGKLELNVGSYTDRVVYRLSKWLGLAVEVPHFTPHARGPSHVRELCEGCKSGHCPEGF